MEEITKIGQLFFQYGGTVIMAILFVYLFFQDRKDLKEEQAKSNTKRLDEAEKNRRYNTHI